MSIEQNRVYSRVAASRPPAAAAVRMTSCWRACSAAVVYPGAQDDVLGNVERLEATVLCVPGQCEHVVRIDAVVARGTT